VTLLGVDHIIRGEQALNAAVGAGEGAQERALGVDTVALEAWIQTREETIRRETAERTREFRDVSPEQVLYVMLHTALWSGFMAGVASQRERVLEADA
jgi:hypothetical protein